MVKRVTVSDVDVPCVNPPEHCVLRIPAAYLSGWYSEASPICRASTSRGN